MTEHFDFSDLLGKTITEIKRYEDYLLQFSCGRYTCYEMRGESNGFRNIIEIESIVGDLDDLIGEPILKAEEVIDKNWTFYKLATIKGYVDIRWCGENSPFYADEVHLIKYEAKQ